MQPRLSDGDLNELRRWSTGAVCNGWEQITHQSDIAGEAINLEPVHDYMPFLGPIAGYAVTVVIQPSDPAPNNGIPARGVNIAVMWPRRPVQKLSSCKTSTSRG